jgi:hypothetical protein
VTSEREPWGCSGLDLPLARTRLDGSASGFGRDELQPIAPGILGEEPCCLADLVVIAGRDARELEPPLEGLKRGFVREAQRRVGLLRGAKVLLCANVDLLPIEHLFSTGERWDADAK